ncbi:hypothetical protein ITP53_05645 [Nonomuraea sp. K274]|uniref:Uncharacterized protein n=1 Tax=Nonomuraea cypriaca TaxID=1187855 RepID=A0A931A5R1_9ACTN|nr:hypothetical protein [Nonomuraea cypriaca]MBF8185229.1 hypothetical protein [Nonomuraea cypriaca]
MNGLPEPLRQSVAARTYVAVSLSGAVGAAGLELYGAGALPMVAAALMAVTALLTWATVRTDTRS